MPVEVYSYTCKMSKCGQYTHSDHVLFVFLGRCFSKHYSFSLWLWFFVNIFWYQSPVLSCYSVWMCTKLNNGYLNLKGIIQVYLPVHCIAALKYSNFIFKSTTNLTSWWFWWDTAFHSVSLVVYFSQYNLIVEMCLQLYISCFC